MIYLIGGAPRTGKTTLANAMSEKLGISFVSTDSLETDFMNIWNKYVDKKVSELLGSETEIEMGAT